MAVSPISLIFKAVDNASGKVKSLISTVGGIAFTYNNVGQAIQSVTAQGQQLYQKLIGQNVELQQQLLSTQSSLVATNKVISQGVEVKDPTAAIKALNAPISLPSFLPSTGRFGFAESVTKSASLVMYSTVLMLSSILMYSSSLLISFRRLESW